MKRVNLRIILSSMLIMTCVYNMVALSGRWRGDIAVGPVKVPLVFNFKVNDAGITEVTLDSPQQNVKDLPAEVKYCKGDSVAVECKMIGAAYSGKVIGNEIKGTFSQRGINLPLTLSQELPLSERRPQTPVPPFPYEVKDTVFTSSDGTILAGTLTIPASSIGKKPTIVVMVTGSGPQNRDEEIFEHRPFAVIADYLARNGIASFRYDDRGIASSKGDFAKATINTFKSDAESALNFVKTFPEFGKAGILGHSEGGSLASLIASEGKPDFIVSLAGMVISAKETLIAQNMLTLDQWGISGEQKEASIKLIEKLFDTIIDQYNQGISTPIDLDQLCKDNSIEVPAMVLESMKRNNAMRSGYFDSLVSLDPTDALKKIKCPILAINGSIDTQVDAEKNLAAFKQYVPTAQIERMEGLNHLMQHANTGETAEYAEIKETISPEVLQIISDFITKQ